MPKTLSQQTGNGVHYIFRLPPARVVNNSAKKLASGLDIRGLGGYIVAAPSVHQNGNTYTWLNCDLPTRDMIAPAPPWLLDLIANPTVSAPGATPGSTVAALACGFHWPDKIEDGSGREDFIVRAAGHLRGTGATQATIERMLLDYNQLHIVPPLADAAVLDRTRRYETADPIHAANDSDWPEPAELNAGLPPVPRFDERLLPPVLLTLGQGHRGTDAVPD